MNIIFGAGGVARELAWIMSDVTLDSAFPEAGVPDAFVGSDDDWAEGMQIDGAPVLRHRDIQEMSDVPVRAFLATGLPAVKMRIYDRLGDFRKLSFPCLVPASVPFDRRAGKTYFGRGIAVYPTASLTTGVRLGDFVHVNPCSTLGHGVKVGNFSTLCPGCNISGNVVIGKGCFIGAGAVIREGLCIADNCVIGAGAVVVKDISEPGTWVGVPARRLPI